MWKSSIPHNTLDLILSPCFYNENSKYIITILGFKYCVLCVVAFPIRL